MKRKEMYKIIKEHFLSRLIQEAYGANYTNVSNEGLEKFISHYFDSIKVSPEPKDEETDKHTCPMGKLLALLYSKRILTRQEVESI